MDVFRQFATDESLEVSGVWRELGGDAKVLVARSGNRAYAKALQKAMEQHKHALDRPGDEADELADKILIDVMARTILIGWENLSFMGEPLAYSAENAKKLLGVKDFRRLIAKLSDDIESYKAKEDAQAGES